MLVSAWGWGTRILWSRTSQEIRLIDMLKGSTMKVVLLICNVQLNSTNSNCTSKAVGRLQVISGYCVLPIRVKLSLVVWAIKGILFSFVGIQPVTWDWIEFVFGGSFGQSID